MVNTVNHSLVLPEPFSPEAIAHKVFIYLQPHTESNLVSSFYKGSKYTMLPLFIVSGFFSTIETSLDQMLML